ncbi:MAG: NIPSNAP family protein [SAR324 cluster bacterium]|nr:NIPSNAP family protein [SAR324 cluster bacterium]
MSTMIYEVRTYDLKPRALPEVEKRFEEVLSHRLKYSPLAAFFHTEIGPLNQIIHIWPYENMGERERIRGEAAQDPNWPPKVAEFIVNMESEIFIPYSFSPEINPGKLGPVFEWRSYMVRPGAIPGVVDRWGPAIEARTKLSPLVVCMHTEAGKLNKYVHIWGYESLSHRAEVRKEAVATGVWPPPGGGDTLISQENKIVIPASFSPLQ